MRAVTSTSTWHLPINVEMARVTSVLESLRFRVTSAIDDEIKARRRSKIQMLDFSRASVSAVSSNLPMMAHLTLSPTASGTRVSLELSDVEPVFVFSEALLRTYNQAFDEVHAAFGSGFAELGAIEESSTGVVADEGLKSKYSDQFRTLARRIGGPRGSADNSRSNAFWIVNGDRRMHLDTDLSEALLYALTIALTDDAMPASLRERMISAQQELQKVHEEQCGREVKVSHEDLPLWDFMYRQATLRLRLPLREIHRCTDCGAEKVVDPVYQRNQARNRRYANIAQVVSSTSMYGPLSLLGVGSRMLSLRGQSAFLCSRCQGTRPEIRPVVICPSCHTFCEDVVLRTCNNGGCAHNYLATVPGLAWHE
jgi:hypothetical protein